MVEHIDSVESEIEKDIAMVTSLLPGLMDAQVTNPKSYEMDVAALRRIVAGKEPIGPKFADVSPSAADELLMGLAEDSEAVMRPELAEILALDNNADSFMGSPAHFVQLDQMDPDEVDIALRESRSRF